MANTAKHVVGVNIGASPTAIKEARGAINDILRAPHVDNSTKVAALNALNQVCQVNNSTVSGCSITMGAK